MILLRLGGTGGQRRGWMGAVAVAVGLAIILSGLALLAVIVLAAAVVGAGILAYRRLTGRSVRRPATGPSPSGMEIAPDFEILPSSDVVAPEVSTTASGRLPAREPRLP